MHTIRAESQTSCRQFLQGCEKCGLENFRVVRQSRIVADRVEAILEGRQPLGLSNAKLLNTPLPLDWIEQRTLLGFT